MRDGPFTWYEFFAGGGMARLGLGERWKCLFANEWSVKKAAAYTAAFGTGEPKSCPELHVQDVATISVHDLPGRVDLAWASFPCQDLSLAGSGAGLQGSRSSAFHPFWDLMRGLHGQERAPRLIVLENVTGLLTSHRGEDFRSLVSLLVTAGYSVGALVIDAVRFLPHSRPRLFVVAVQTATRIPVELRAAKPTEAWHPETLRVAHQQLPDAAKQCWIWWRLPVPAGEAPLLFSLIEKEPQHVRWHSRTETERLVELMSPANAGKVAAALRAGENIVGTLYRRTRPTAEGGRQQRAEVRFDGIAGCLRTPAGGSSRQTVVLIEGQNVRSRLLSSREAARLMGVPDSYPVPHNYNDAYHLFGDGLAVPVVRWLAEHLLQPLVSSGMAEIAA